MKLFPAKKLWARECWLTTAVTARFDESPPSKFPALQQITERLVPRETDNFVSLESQCDKINYFPRDQSIILTSLQPRPLGEGKAPWGRGCSLVRASCADCKISRVFLGIKSDTAVLSYTFRFLTSFFFHFYSLPRLFVSFLLLCIYWIVFWCETFLGKLLDGRKVGG